MKVSQAIEMLEQLNKRKPDEDIVMFWFTRHEFDISAKNWDKVIDDVIHYPTVDEFWCNIHETINDVLEELMRHKWAFDEDK